MASSTGWNETGPHRNQRRVPLMDWPKGGTSTRTSRAKDSDEQRDHQALEPPVVEAAWPTHRHAEARAPPRRAASSGRRRDRGSGRRPRWRSPSTPSPRPRDTRTTTSREEPQVRRELARHQASAPAPTALKTSPRCSKLSEHVEGRARGRQQHHVARPGRAARAARTAPSMDSASSTAATPAGPARRGSVRGPRRSAPRGAPARAPPRASGREVLALALAARDQDHRLGEALERLDGGVDVGALGVVVVRDPALARGPARSGGPPPRKAAIPRRIARRATSRSTARTRWRRARSPGCGRRAARSPSPGRCARPGR